VPEEPQVKIGGFADVKRIIGAPDDVNEPHRNDDAIVRLGSATMEDGQALRRCTGTWLPFDSVAPLPRSFDSPHKTRPAMSEPRSSERGESNEKLRVLRLAPAVARSGHSTRLTRRGLP
jgi:hypothetical protein